MSRGRIKTPTASLDLIAAANGRKTGDELRQEALDARQSELHEIRAAEVVPLTAKQRRNLRAVMAKAGKDILGRPLDQEQSPAAIPAPGAAP